MGKNRFGFGKNWKSFIKTLDEKRIDNFKKSLIEMLEVDNLKGKTFLDIGSGSGVFSLAATQLGAKKVFSFDYDKDSVECTKYIKSAFNKSADWTIEEGSVLNETYMNSIGKFDVVYSWGVLHHTGEMYKALHNATIPLKKDGILFIAIYNHQGWRSRLWRLIKKLYNKNFIFKYTFTFLGCLHFIIDGFMLDVFLFRKNPYIRYKKYKANRGMSIIHDWIDWIGGYPYEYARAETIHEFYKKRGFQLQKFTTTNRIGCNQLVLKKMK